MGTAATDDNTGMDEYKKWGERVNEFSNGMYQFRHVHF